MAEKHLVVCDSCGKQEDSHAFDGFWYKVQTAVAKHEQLADGLAQVAAGMMKMSDLVDYGDFCSLECVANWASTRAELRHLSDDLEQGKTYDEPQLPLALPGVVALTPEQFAAMVAGGEFSEPTGEEDDIPAVTIEVIEKDDDPVA